ncbi:MAG: sodium:solute symporter family protein, partial [Verrucomicrobiota bacterium]
IGGAGFYYIHGVGNFYFASIAYCILAVITGTLGRRFWVLSRKYPEIRSPIQLYLRHFNSPGLETCFVVVSLLCLVPYMAAQITGFGWLVQSALGVPYLYAAGAGLVVVFLYSEAGGIKNIVKTDVLQSLMTIVGCIGVVAVFIWSFWKWDLAAFFEEVDALAEPSLLGIPGPEGFYSVLNIASLALLISLGAVPMAHNAQRYMMVRDVVYLKRLMWMFPLMGIFVTVAAGFIGLGGAVQFPGLESGDQVIGAVTASVLPVVGALATIGIIAATMSTADSILLSVGFVVSEQWYRGRSNEGAKAVLRLNRWCALAVILFAFVSSIRPELITQFAFNAFGGMLQLAPVMIAGVYEIKVGKVAAAISFSLGICIVVVGTMDFYGELIPLKIPPYLLGFFVACLALLIARAWVFFKSR